MSKYRGSFDNTPFTSNAEHDLREMFQIGHNKGELLKMPWTGHKMAMHPVHGVVDKGEYPRKELFIHYPDFYWQIGTVSINLELDGPPHLKQRIADRDKKINKLLEDSGVVLVREPYVTMTKGNLKRIYLETCQLIKKNINIWRGLNGGPGYGSR